MKTKSQAIWFTQDILDYLKDLGENNNSKWFTANRERYEKSVNEPMKALAAELIPMMREIDPEITMQPHEALFKMGRDTRLSYDKSPYKTHVGMLISRQGAKQNTHPGLYVQIAAKGFGVASGFHALEPSECMAIRRFLAAHPAEFLAQLNAKEFHQYFLAVRGEAGKILPPEFREAAEKQPLIYNKQFYYWAEHRSERVLSGDLPEFIMEHMRACRPMNEFLSQAFK